MPVVFCAAFIYSYLIKFIVLKFGTIFKLLNKNYVIMEMRKENREKRRKKIIHKCAELVRSVKPGHNSVIAWEKETSHSFKFWKTYPAA